MGTQTHELEATLLISTSKRTGELAAHRDGRLFTFLGCAPALQLPQQLLHQLVNRLDLFRRRRRQAGSFQGQLTGQQQRRNRAVQFAAHPANHRPPRPLFLALAALDRFPDLAHQTLHSTDPQIDLRRDGGTQVRERGLGFTRRSFDQILIEHSNTLNE